MSKKISTRQLRKFGILIAISFPFFVGWLVPWLHGHSFLVWTLYISSVSCLLAIISPGSLTIPYKVWMILGNCLGLINSRIILGLIFFLVLQPIALIMMVFDYDPLKKKKNNNKTYRENIPSNKEIDFTRIF